VEPEGTWLDAKARCLPRSRYAGKAARPAFAIAASATRRARLVHDDGATQFKPQQLAGVNTFCRCLRLLCKRGGAVRNMHLRGSAVQSATAN
jgi:hypothetical protein